MRLRPRPWVYWDKTPVTTFFPAIPVKKGQRVAINDQGFRIVRVDHARRRIKVKPLNRASA